MKPTAEPTLWIAPVFFGKPGPGCSPTLTIDFFPQRSVACSVVVLASAASLTLQCGAALVLNFMFFGKSTIVRVAAGGWFWNSGGESPAWSLFCVSTVIAIVAGLNFFFDSFFGVSLALTD